MNGIAETGFLVACASRGAPHHRWASEIIRQVSLPLLTSESVLSEVGFQRSPSSYALSLVRRGIVRLAFDVNRNLDVLTDLAERYADRSSDLTDLCVVRMREDSPRHSAVTRQQRVFGHYREHNRQSL